MVEKAGCRSKFSLIPFYELCLKITTYSIYRHASPSFSMAHARRMSQFQTLIRLRDSSLNTQTLIFVVFIDATIPWWKMCLVQTRHKKFFCLQCMVHFFKVTTFLWIILILHPSHTSLFRETVIIKFGGGRGADIWGRGPRAEKNKYPLFAFLALSKNL